MRTWICTICLSLAVASQLLAESADARARSEAALIGAQRKTLAEAGLWGFFALAQSNRWDAPKIHSQCWVDWLPVEKEGLRRLEQARRDFGLEIVGAVEGEVLHALEPANSPERAAQAEHLLAFSQWAGAPGGYGNLAIKRRVEHLACIPIGHLVADLDYPVEKIDAALARFSSDEAWLAMQVAVLNEEAPHRFSAKTQDELALQWHRYFRKAVFAFKDIKGRYPYNHAESLDLPREVSFYCEDESSTPPRTLSSHWNLKRHYLFCVRGKTDPIAERVNNLLLFRKTIRRFPEMPSRPLGMFDSRVQEGFYEAWKPHEETQGIHPGASGYTYEAIRRGSFMDYDTSELVASRGTNNVSITPAGAGKKTYP